MTSAPIAPPAAATFAVEDDADQDTLDALVDASRRRSATYEMLVNPIPVQIATVSSSTTSASRVAPDDGVAPGD